MTVESHVDGVLDCLPALRGKERSVTPLRGSRTDQHFLVDTSGATFVLHLGGTYRGGLGSDPWVQFACTHAAAKVGSGSPVVDFLPEYPALLTRFVPGRLLRPADVRESSTLSRIVEALRRSHTGPAGEGTSSPFDAIRDYYTVAWNRQVAFPPTIGEAMLRLAEIEARLPVDDLLCPCHNNLHASKLVDDGSTVVLLDWDYGGMGNCFADLGNLAANNDFDEVHEHNLLTLYFGTVQPDHLEALRLMRLASDMREAMWGFFQAAISPTDYDFLDYGRLHLRRFLTGSQRLGIGPIAQLASQNPFAELFGHGR